MSKEEFDGKWTQIQGHFKEWWSELTDDDLKQAGGQYDRMIGMIQHRYGHKRARVKRELNAHMATFLVHPNDSIVARPA